MFLQAEVLVSYYFPFLEVESLEIDDLMKWFARVLFVEERQFNLFKAAIISALSGKE